MLLFCTLVFKLQLRGGFDQDWDGKTKPPVHLHSSLGYEHGSVHQSDGNATTGHHSHYMVK